MSINDLTTKIKSFLANTKDQIYSKENGLKIKGDLFIVLLLILIGTASFGLGKLSALEKKKTPISIIKTKELLTATVAESLNDINTPSTAKTQTQGKGIVLASKSGTKYYYPWCTGVSRIKEENKVWFLSIEDARSAGLTPASGCTGLK
ncbi:MAG: hypothetical protein NTU76_02770 [Candidatus Taylorbacteria bacterium]|nr:hypothetical protein [Candidatus Taylorbacteria bacterium]